MLPAKTVKEKSRKSTQYAALCYRLSKDEKLEILLVTSRGAGRWIPPKGWPIPGLAPHKSAAQEAFEEAGVLGDVHKFSLGRYKYLRDRRTDRDFSSEAFVFPLRVTKMAKKYKEKGQRRVKWYSQKKAAQLVREPNLKKIIRKFDPQQLVAA